MKRLKRIAEKYAGWIGVAFLVITCVAAMATDQQMQQFANERMRVQAERFRLILSACKNDKAALDDIYDRAANGDPWADGRSDGPPRLLTDQDMLVYNTVISNFIEIVEGTETGTEEQINAQRAAKVAGIRDNWNVFQSMCVRPVQ